MIMGIPEVELPGSSDAITDKVAEYQTPDTESEPEAKKYKISFDKYIVDECGINNFNGHYAQSAVRVIRDIGLSFDGTGISSSEAPRIEHVYRYSDRAKNEYAVFYKDIEEDAEIKEVKVVNTVYVRNPATKKKESREIDYRIFFYITPHDSTFHIRAITDDHKNIRKTLPRG
ncbi:MAG: hypothetical protein WC767_00180 [Candidatus Paceibacterota bacterium]|jgi:hypothetical protein